MTCLNSADCIQNLSEYQYIWIIFIFHENTNTSRLLKLELLSEQEGSKKNLSNVKSKVKVPRLNGGKVGLFATRTPHRPNPIGLSVVRIDKILDNKIFITGLDLVDGTPVLDIKPYIPSYDSIKDAIVPNWIQDSVVKSLKDVFWTEDAMKQLTQFVENKTLEYYDNFDDIKNVISDIVKLDIRSSHQRNQANSLELQQYNFRIDILKVNFTFDGNDLATVQSISI
jgi:tRNA-Thr(GGU) m(6)t(6)A37 methyltransferase TsaA